VNLPNKITIGRIILTFVFMILLFSGGVLYKIFALIVFVLAALSDLLDGYLAKRNNDVTDFGKLMDPIADKILVLAAFLAFVEMQLVPAWMVVIIIFRELAITGLRILALAKKEILPASMEGKHKTVSQMVSIFTILVFIVVREMGIRFFDIWGVKAEHWFKNMIFLLMLITVALTLISGVSYLWKNRKILIRG